MQASNKVSSDNKAQLQAVALFVSDVHLHPLLPRTTDAFIGFLREQAAHAQQLFLLGDLFEYWAGDDDAASAYPREIIEALRDTADAGVDIFWIGGNRDFLVGQEFAMAAHVTHLQEPFVTEIANQRIVLVHGDAQCTDDEAYMKFRAQVRDPEWQKNFLGIPLAQRKAIIDGMRNGSREAQRSKSYEIMDVNAQAIASLFESSEATIMIHGHTHRPAMHYHEVQGRQRTRHVLPDWDCDTVSARGGWLALYSDGSIKRFECTCGGFAKK